MTDIEVDKIMKDQDDIQEQEYKQDFNQQKISMNMDIINIEAESVKEAHQVKKQISLKTQQNNHEYIPNPEKSIVQRQKNKEKKKQNVNKINFDSEIKDQLNYRPFRSNDNNSQIQSNDFINQSCIKEKQKCNKNKNSKELMKAKSTSILTFNKIIPSFNSMPISVIQSKQSSKQFFKKLQKHYKKLGVQPSEMNRVLLTKKKKGKNIIINKDEQNKKIVRTKENKQKTNTNLNLINIKYIDKQKKNDKIKSKQGQRQILQIQNYYQHKKNIDENKGSKINKKIIENKNKQETKKEQEKKEVIQDIEQLHLVQQKQYQSQKEQESKQDLKDLIDLIDKSSNDIIPKLILQSNATEITEITEITETSEVAKIKDKNKEKMKINSNSNGINLPKHQHQHFTLPSSNCNQTIFQNNNNRYRQRIMQDSKNRSQKFKQRFSKFNVNKRQTQKKDKEKVQQLQ